MHYSKNNIIGKIKNSDDYFIINVLSGNADILTEQEYQYIKNNSFTNKDQLIEKGYITYPEKELQSEKLKYLDFIDIQDSDEIQLFFVLTYQCNFNCDYCYQHNYSKDKISDSTQAILSFFDYIDKTFSNKKKYITMFGGEPLLNNEYIYNNIKLILDETKKRNMSTAIVTNGYNLLGYIELFKQYDIREIQVTLDGTEKVHNKRRKLKNGSDTYTKIISGIEKALSENLSINLRIVLDKDNVQNFQDLAEFCIKKGWTKLKNFKTQIGRNYELHDTYFKNNLLFSRLEMYETLYDIYRNNPHLIEFHNPDFSISRYLIDNGKLPDPIFDSCPGCKNEWAFDYKGDIYSCTATVGKQAEKLGTFYPEIVLDTDKIRQWQNRDINSIDKCKDCNLKLICGGGCAIIAKNKNGDFNTPDCRPHKELIELGLSMV